MNDYARAAFDINEATHIRIDANARKEKVGNFTTQVKVL
jgi:hypothetical protein